MTRLRALVFDVDGTLAETEELHRRAFNQTFLEAGIGWHWDRSEYKRLLRTTGGKERMQKYRADIGHGNIDDTSIVTWHRKKTALYAKLLEGGTLRLRLGIRELIADGRRAGLKIAIATTTSRTNVDALCQSCWSLDAEELFDVVAAGDEVARKKPAPDVFLLALDRLGLPASDAFAFEDSVAGLAAANAAGLATIVTPSTYTEDDDFTEAAHVCRSLARANLPAALSKALQF